MSQRRALAQLHNYLLLQQFDGATRDRLVDGLRRLGLEATIPPDLAPPDADGNLPPAMTAALEELSASPPPPPGDTSPPPPIAPLEGAHVLVQLSKQLRPARRGIIDLPGEGGQTAVAAIARRLVGDPDADEDDAQALLEVIDAMHEEEDALVRVHGLDDDLTLRPTTGPSPPSSGPVATETVGDVLDRAAARVDRDRPPVHAALAAHPVVDVDAAIYRSLVGGAPEYPVHLRTTLRFAGRPAEDLERFRLVLDPQQWPKYNSFWRCMELQPIGAAALSAGVPGEVVDAAGTLDQAIGDLASPWERVGTFLEVVGFEPDHENLYPGTYLFFTRHDEPLRSVLSYTLTSGATCRLGVDDGCIEIQAHDGAIDVMTTKSLYVRGTGADSELGGILAYMAATCGWGTQTLALVANAVDRAP